MCKTVGAKREQAGRGIVTFVHLSFRLSGAVITATGGSLLCLVLGRRAKSAVNGKTQWESLEKCKVPGGTALLCPHIDNTLLLCEQLELFPKLQQFFRMYLGEIGSVLLQFEKH